MKKLQVICTILAGVMMSGMASSGNTTEEIGSVDIKRIQTPDSVKSSIGTLEFIDGAPLPETAQKVYDYLDTMRGVDAFLKGIPAASIQGMMEGPRVIGQKASNQVVIFEELADANSLYLTTNTSTMYVFGKLDLKVDGPTVVEIPPGMLGAFQDAWFRFAGDIGPFGQDKGKGGKYLVLPPGYDGEVPDDYFIIKSRSYKMMAFTRVLLPTAWMLQQEMLGKRRSTR